MTIIQTQVVTAPPVVQTQIVNGTPVQVVVTATPAPVQPTAAPVALKSKDPTTFVQETFGDAETLDPALDYETAGGQIIQNLYDTLVFYNKDNPIDFVPQLATEVPTRPTAASRLTARPTPSRSAPASSSTTAPT